MANGKFVAYYRVSTAKQGVSGLGLEAQQDAVRGYLNGGKWSMVEEVTEIESGKRNDRPALARALSLCRVHNAKLVIAKLDRLARNVYFISGLMESNVEFVAVDFPEANRLTIHILASVAEHEREMISKRTKEALAAAKRRGVKLGGDRGRLASQSLTAAKASALVRVARAGKRNADLAPVVQSIRAEGATTLRAVAKVLNHRGIVSPSGGRWHANSVRRVVALTAHGGKCIDV
jgi:DNA invertase Pin-like site-specific DNA recombinase